MENLIKKLKDLREKVSELKKKLNISGKKDHLQELNSLIAQSDFWLDKNKAVQISQTAENLKSEIFSFEELEKEINSLEELALLADKYQDRSMDDDISHRFFDLENKFSQLDFLLLFSGEDDNSSAILSIHAGTGGVDAQDWAEILERMYLRFAEKKNFKVEILDRVLANEAGIKSVSFRISGAYAYGNLKSENGVHRLVRISPFDAEQMRHTSFAGVEVLPEIRDENLLELNEKDLRIDVYRSSGPGGQGVNTTDSAVRITHLPTNISVACQSERSQHQNKERALLILKSKLYQKEQDAKELKEKEIKGDAGQGTWGKQIRSYVFQPYQMVKDHRSNFSVSDISSVMDGDLDPFIKAYLSLILENKNK